MIKWFYYKKEIIGCSMEPYITEESRIMQNEFFM